MKPITLLAQTGLYDAAAGCGADLHYLADYSHLGDAQYFNPPGYFNFYCTVERTITAHIALTLSKLPIQKSYIVTLFVREAPNTIFYASVEGAEPVIVHICNYMGQIPVEYTGRSAYSILIWAVHPAPTTSFELNKIVISGDK